jgi:hypothetical protein
MCYVCITISARFGVSPFAGARPRPGNGYGLSGICALLARSAGSGSVPGLAGARGAVCAGCNGIQGRVCLREHGRYAVRGIVHAIRQL